MTRTDRGAAAPLTLALRVLVVIALGVSAYAHFKLAKTYDPIHKSVSQGDLFRVEGVIASLAAIFLLINDRVIGWAPAFLVGVGALGAVLTYRYVNVGSIGPIPNMYEPIWKSQDNLKVISAIAEGFATLGAAAGLLSASVRR